MTRIAHCRQTAWLPNHRWNRRLTPVCRRVLVNETLPDLLCLTRFSREQEGFEYGDPVQDFTQRGGKRRRLRILAANASNPAVSMPARAPPVERGLLGSNRHAFRKPVLSPPDTSTVVYGWPRKPHLAAIHRPDRNSCSQFAAGPKSNYSP
jgi:hypothetical protein